MKIESALRQINKRVAEYKDYFGKYSYEYGYAKNLIVTALKDYVDPEAVAKYTGKGIQLSRSKPVISMLYDNEVLSENLFEVWDKLKAFGTVKSIVNEYTGILDSSVPETEYDVSDNDMVKAEIQQLSAETAKSVFNDDDYYSWLMGEIDEATADNRDYLQSMYDKFKEEAPGVKKDIKWEKIKDMYSDYQDEFEDGVRKKAGV